MFKGLHYDMFMINFDLENNSDKLCPIEGPGQAGGIFSDRKSTQQQV